MNQPNFIIIGAAKSGTTTLYEYLCRHRQVYMSLPKEPDFFSLDSNYARGIDWYRSLFASAQSDQICGEASTTYSRLQQHPKTIERLVDVLPNAKLIYIMRHPVDRAYSFYTYRFKGSQQNAEFLAARNELVTARTFEQAIEQNSEFIDSSYYLYQINKYLEYYPKESFLFLLMEDLIHQPEEEIKKICDFIGVDSTINLMPEGEIVANQAGDQPEWYVRQQLTSGFKSIPGASLVKNLLPQAVKDTAYETIKSLKYKQWKSEQYMPPPMRPETRQNLLEQFKQPNQQLAEFLGRDLSHWNS
ncbi:MAG: sulfotransferase domain-containing protein [Microcoleaceae cyanobacterium]